MATNDDMVKRAEAALDDGDTERAIALADEVLKFSPKHVGATLLKVDALVQLDEIEQAAPLLDRLAMGNPTDLVVLLAVAEFASDFEAEDHERVEEMLDLLVRAEKLATKAGDKDGLGRVEWLRGHFLGALAELAPAAAAYERARRHLGDDHDLLVDLAVAKFELLEVNEARRLLDEAVRRDPEDARAHHFLARVLERLGQAKDAEKGYARATKLDPEGFPPPVHLSKSRFEEVVEGVLEHLPAEVKEALANVPVIVEELPQTQDLRGDPPLSPMSLGMFKGHPVAGHGARRGEMELPPQILLFQKNIERACANEGELADEIETTVLHEIGHAVGWDEDDLYDRGLE